MNMLLQATHALLDQLAELLSGLDDASYASVLPALAAGSIGQHLRHVLDHYQALLNREHGVIDYDLRRRDSLLECSRTVALAEIRRVLAALSMLGDGPVRVRAEVSPCAQAVAEVDSTIARELMFATSHAVHHFALIALLLRVQGQPVPAGFGVAPATLSHQRQLQAV